MIDVHVDHPTWMADAACHGIGDMFYVETHADESLALAAKRVCALCPVRLECLSYALERNERWGIWGGATATERMKMRKQDQDDVHVDHVEIDRVVRLLLHDNEHGYKGYASLNAIAKSIVVRILVHEHKWTISMIRRHLRMNGTSASHRYHSALDAGAVNLLKESA